jgi:hypothetical protein
VHIVFVISEMWLQHHRSILPKVLSSALREDAGEGNRGLWVAMPLGFLKLRLDLTKFCLGVY